MGHSSENESSGLAPGALVGSGRYQLVKILGRGGMGVVWLAEDSRLHEKVALKFLPPEISGDSVALDDMRRETQKAHKLSHPNIVRIHDLFEAEDERPSISMEYIDRPNLSDLRLKEENRVFTWAYLQPLVKQLCEALKYAHEERVICAAMPKSGQRISLTKPSSGTITHMS
ncbi:MAG: serine/threonine protein kinase, partial [Candidatus Binatia bacterium]